MTDNVPMDDTEVLRRIRGVLAEPYNADYMVQQIRDLLDRPKPEPRPIRKDSRGWPILPPSSGVVDLPDSRWLDTGSGPGYTLPAAEDQGDDDARGDR